MPTALVIDDNFHNRHIFRIALTFAGYDVTEADDGLTGLDALQSSAFQLIILDLRMPGLDGTEVLKILRRSDEWQKIQVVVVTANPHMVTEEVLTLSDYVLQKPVDITTFSALAQRLYARSVALTTAPVSESAHDPSAAPLSDPVHGTTVAPTSEAARDQTTTRTIETARDSKTE